jgi:hypothetical protein
MRSSVAARAATLELEVRRGLRQFHEPTDLCLGAMERPVQRNPVCDRDLGRLTEVGIDDPLEAGGDIASQIRRQPRQHLRVKDMIRVRTAQEQQDVFISRRACGKQQAFV